VDDRSYLGEPTDPFHRLVGQRTLGGISGWVCPLGKPEIARSMGAVLAQEGSSQLTPRLANSSDFVQLQENRNRITE
jgi:hypothetical protein